MPMPMRRRRAALLPTLMLPAAALADGGLLSVSDQNPLIRGAYLPLPPLAGEPQAGWGFAAGLQLSNTVNIESSATEQLTVDEETAELDLELSRALDAWRVRAWLPVLHRDGGLLDTPIEDWHRFWGLPRGDRPLRPRNAYLIAYANSSGTSFEAQRGTALGDVALEAGRALIDRASSRLLLMGGLTVPSGDRARLAGDGAVNAALWLEGAAALGSRFTLDARAGISHTGGTLPLPAERRIAFGTLAVTWRATARLDATVQLDGHTRVVSGSDLPFLSHALVGTFGGRFRLVSGSTLEFGVSEDVEVDHSPDVSFHVGWRSPLGKP
jgi:hypothetical protein